MISSQNVASSVSTVAVGFAPLLSDALLDQACTEHHIAFVREPTELVDLGVCRDTNGALRGVKRDPAYSRWCRASGGRAGPPCHSDDSKCKSGCYRGRDAEGKYDVRDLTERSELDWVEEGSRYLKVVDKFNEWTVSAFITPGSEKSDAYDDYGMTLTDTQT